MEQLKQLLPSLGLELNLAKCKVFGPNAHSAVHQGLADIPRVTFADGIVVLGAPIGSDTFIQQSMATLVNKLVSLLNKVGRLDSSLAKFLIFRASFVACWVNHLLRSLDLKHSIQLALDSGVVFQTAFDNIIGSKTTTTDYGLACMSSVAGGLGLRNPNKVLGPAFLASTFSFVSKSEVALPLSFWSDLMVLLQNPNWYSI